MATHRFAAGDPREGERLRAAIEAETSQTATVVLVGDEWAVTTDADKATVKAVVDAHDGTPGPVPPTSEERLAAVEARLDRAANQDVSGDAAKLRDAVRG